MRSNIFNIGRYINNVTSLQFFQLFRFSMLLLISIVFTKTNLGIGEIGIYETFILIAGGVSFFWIGGFLQSLLSIFNNNKTYNKLEKDSIFFNVFLLFSVFSFLAGVFVYISQDYIAKLLNLSSQNIPYMKILFMYICVSGPVNLIEYIYLLKNKSKHIIYYGTISFILQFICVTTPVVLGYDLGYGLYGLVFINILRFVLLIYLVIKYSQITISTKFLIEYLKLSNPLIISLLIGGSATYFDGFLVSNQYNEATFAIFRYGARELPFVILLANAFSNALTPTFSDRNNLDSALNYLKKGSKKLMYILFPSSILFLFISKYLFPIVFNPNFTQSADIFNIYLLIIISRLLFPQTVLIGLKRTNIIMYAASIELIVNITLSIVFIHLWGIIGVALATVIAFLLEKIILVSYLQKKESIRITKYLDLKNYIILSGLTIITFLISFYLL